MGLIKWDKYTTSIIFSTLSLVLYFFNMIFDLINAYNYVKSGECWFGCALLLAHLLPSAITMFLSRKIDEIQNESKQNGKVHSMNVIKNPPVLRSLNSIYFAVKAFQAFKAKNVAEELKYRKMMDEENETRALLNVEATIVESGLQQMVLIMFLLKHSSEDGYHFTYLAIAWSFVSMAWSLIMYLQNIHHAQGQNHLSLFSCAFVIQFLSHFCSCVSQVVMLSVLLYSTWWTLLGICIHWIVSMGWHCIVRPHYLCSSINSCYTGKHSVCEKTANSLVSAYFGLIYIVTFIPLCEGSNFYGYLFVFVCSFVENLSGAVVWSNLIKTSSWPNLSFIPFMFFILFLVGYVLTVLYYIFIHPKRANLSWGLSRQVLLCFAICLGSHAQQNL